jgi:hypothetical protein
MKIDIGNLNNYEKVKIKFVYLEELEVAMNKFWKYKILSNITPRYSRNK